jgi:tyrosine-protein kinase Etk/Wzc
VSTLDSEVREISYSSYDRDVEDERPGKPVYEYVRLLFGLVRVVSQERRKLLIRTLVVMALTLGYMFLIPNRYTATAVLTPPDSEPISGLDMLIGSKTGMSSAIASSQMGDMLGMRSPGQLYIQQMMSRPVQDRLIERFSLKAVYRTQSSENARKALTAATGAEEDRKSGAIRISVTDKNPKLAADLANAYAEESGLMISKLNADTAKNERGYFEVQLQQAKDELQKDVKELAAFGIQNGTIDTTAQGSALAAAASTVESDILATEAELKGLLQIYTPQHERVLAMQAKLAELRQQLQQLKGKAPSSASSGTDTLKDVLSASPMYLELERKVKTQESIVETLSQQFELSKLQERHKVSNVQVFDPAVVPERKSAPHRATVTLFVGIILLMVQAAYFIVRNCWRVLPINDPWRRTLEPAVNGVVNFRDRVLSILLFKGRDWRVRTRRDREDVPVDELMGRS